MALDIGVGDHDTYDILQNEPSIWLGGMHYEFMSPFFKQLEEEIGKRISPYGYASLNGKELTAAEGMLNRAVEKLATQPESWEVSRGIIQLPDEQALAIVQSEYPDTRFERSSTFYYKMIETVHKDAFLKVMEEWRIVIARARELKLAMLCLGD